MSLDVIKNKLAELSNGLNQIAAKQILQDLQHWENKDISLFELKTKIVQIRSKHMKHPRYHEIYFICDELIQKL